EEIRRYFTVTEMANGFGNRHLWFCVRRSKCLAYGGRWMPDSDLSTRLQAALDHASRIGEIPHDASAMEVWESVYPELSQGRPGLFGSMVARAAPQVLRVACLYAVLDLSPAVQ